MANLFFTKEIPPPHTTQDGVNVSGGVLVQSKAEKLMIKNDQIHFVKAKALSDICEKPLPGEHYIIITEKQFNAYALILHVLETKIIEELYLAIYRINQPTVQSIIQLIEESRIKRASFIISNFFNQTKRPEQWAIQLKTYCSENPDKTQHAYVHNHAKVLILKTASGDHLIFEGSGNMSDNARIEQYRYENNEMIYNFHKQWMQEVIDKTNE